MTIIMSVCCRLSLYELVKLPVSTTFILKEEFIKEENLMYAGEVLAMMFEMQVIFFTQGYMARQGSERGAISKLYQSFGLEDDPIKQEALRGMSKRYRKQVLANYKKSDKKMCPIPAQRCPNSHQSCPKNYKVVPPKKFIEMTASEQIIGGYSPTNAPFVLSVYVIDHADVLSVMDPSRHKLPGGTSTRIPFGGIVLKTGAAIYKMKFPPMACSFSQGFARSDAGTSHPFQIDFAIPASREDLTAWYIDRMQKQFVCLVEDANRQGYIIGNEERGLRVNLAQRISGVNEHGVSFSGTLNLPSFLLPSVSGGIVLADLFPDTDFGIDFSLDFNA